MSGWLDISECRSKKVNHYIHNYIFVYIIIIWRTIKIESKRERRNLKKIALTLYLIDFNSYLFLAHRKHKILGG